MAAHVVWSSTRLGDGTTRIVIKLPDAVATRLRTYLEALTSPTPERGAGGRSERRSTYAAGRVSARCSRTWERKWLPVHGGDATTVIVTVPLEDSAWELGAVDLGSRRTSALERYDASPALPRSSGGAEREVRGPRPWPLLEAVQARAAQGDGHPGPGVPRRGLHDPCGLVRGPSLAQTLGPGRSDRPGRWRTAL